MITLTLQPRAQGCAFVVTEDDKIVLFGHTPGVETIKRLKKPGMSVVVLPPPDKITPDPAIAKEFEIPEVLSVQPNAAVVAALAKVK